MDLCVKNVKKVKKKFERKSSFAETDLLPLSTVRTMTQSSWQQRHARNTWSLSYQQIVLQVIINIPHSV
jgi:hypothetical protein